MAIKAKFWCKQLLVIKPDMTPYLMASPRAKLMEGSGRPLLYTNPKQVIANSLENEVLQ